MKAEIVGVGTELLLGQIANTNAQWMSQKLAEIGVDVLHHEVVGDNLERIVATLEIALGRADVVLVTGGLGPTGDDITRDAVAAVMDVPLVRHAELEEMLWEKFGGMGREMPLSNLRQADVPEGARFVRPRRGTAPGLVCDLPEGRRLYAMAGVPAEMQEIMLETVLPELEGLSGPAVLASTVIRCAGIGESAVAEKLQDLFERSENPSIAYLATGGEVKVRVTAKAAVTSEADDLARPLVREILARLGDVVFTMSDEELEESVGRLLRKSGRTVACAESLTGGGIARRLTAVPGASAYVAGGAVAYTSDAKRRILGVSQVTIDGPGVVSEACALEMAAGARRVFAADVSVAVTGVAGPDPLDGRHPGLVWLALEADDRVHAHRRTWEGEREQVRRWTEQAALDLLRRYLDGSALPGSDPV